MRIIETPLTDVKIIEPAVFGDDRGFFMETWSQRAFAEHGIDQYFVQDNHSRSGRGVLRGMHYQIKNPQGKLVRVTLGEVFDVVVDMRKSSKQFGEWFGTSLTGSNKRQLWVPPGFAHGFLVVSESADFQYKCTDFYTPEHERSLIWNDPDVGIEWPLGDMQPQLAEKDKTGLNFTDCETYP